MVTHPIEPGWFAPPHTHTREDEYSYILDGRFGFEIGDREFEAAAGSLVFKPRDVRHAFWNLGAGRGLILEIVSPAGLAGRLSPDAIPGRLLWNGPSAIADGFPAPPRRPPG